MAAVFYDTVSDRQFIGQDTLEEPDSKITPKSMYIEIDFDAARNLAERLACQTMSEDALSRVWDTPEEDARWADLKSASRPIGDDTGSPAETSRDPGQESYKKFWPEDKAW